MHDLLAGYVRTTLNCHYILAYNPSQQGADATYWRLLWERRSLMVLFGADWV